MKKKQDPGHEGHTKEWEDRARIEMYPEKDIRKMASPNQSPLEEEQHDDEENKKDDVAY